MKRVLLGVFSLCIAVGCDKPSDGGKGEAKGASSAAASSQPTAAAPAVVFAGTYRAAWGDTVFTASGGAVNATYPGGTLACVPHESALDCTWKEGAQSGKAQLTRGASGVIEGSWGNGDSARDGGKWTFTPKK